MVRDQTVRVWEVETGEQIRAFQGHSAAKNITLPPKAERFLSPIPNGVTGAVGPDNAGEMFFWDAPAKASGR